MGDPNDSTNPETPKPLSAEDVANVVNAAITAHESRNAKKRAEETAKLIEGAIGTALSKLAPATGGALPPAPPPLPGGDGKGSAEGDPRVAALQAKHTEMEAELKKYQERVKAEQDARAAAESKARDDRTFNDLRSLLSEHVRKDMLDDLVTLQFHGQKRVSFDEDGAPLFKVRRAPAAGLPEEDQLMLLADGVQHWVKSKDAARWLPPPNSKDGTSGAGGIVRNGRPSVVKTYDKPAATEDERILRSIERESALKDRFGE